MAIILAAILLSVVLTISPLAALKNALGAGGLANFLAIIGILFCLPLGYGWFSVVTGNGSGDGWYEVSMLTLGLASAFIGTLVSLWALSSARRKEMQFQEKLKGLETGQHALERTEPPITRKMQ